MKRRTLLATLFSLIILLQTALGADLQFEGTPTYSVARSKVNLTIPKIVNNSTTTSGAIYVQVWAMDAPYSGEGTFPGGYIIATKPLAALRAGRAYTNIVTSVPFKIPGDGTHYTLIAIHEVKPNTIPVDFVNAPGMFTFVNGPQVNMEGPATWTMTSSAVFKMTVAKISNDALSGRSGSLRLELWASPNPYEGTGLPQNGYMLGAGLLSPISAGYSVSNIVKTAALRSPPGGYYYTTLIVTEYTRTGYIPRDFIAIPDTFYFGGPSANAPKLDLQGPVSWAILGTTIKVSGGKIINPRNGSASGALQLKLYATEQQVVDTLPENAILLATANLGTVKGKATMNKPSRTVAFAMPPTNIYFTTFVLVETISPGVFVQQDLLPLQSTVSIENKSKITINEGTPIPTNALVNLHISKPAYSISGTNLIIKIPKILNYEPFGTGRLIVQMYLLQSLTNTNNVYIIGQRDLGSLVKGAYFENINGPVPYTKPPVPGSYFALTQFLEYAYAGTTNAGYFNRGYYIFPTKIVIR